MCLEEYDAEFHERSLRQEERESGRQEGIFGAVQILINMGLDEDNIIQKISEQFNLSKNEAATYIHSYNR